MHLRRLFLFYFGISCYVVLLALTTGFAEQVSESKETKAVQYYLNIRNIGNFLSNPQSEKLEFFRRLGRTLTESSTHFQEGLLEVAGFGRPSDHRSGPFSQTRYGYTWSDEEREACKKLSSSFANQLDEIKKEIVQPQEGFYLEGIIDPAMFPTQEVLEVGKLGHSPVFSPGVSKLALQMENISELAKGLVFVGCLGREGASFRLDIVGSGNFSEILSDISVTGHPKTLAKVLDPEALFLMYQVQKLPSTQEMMSSLRMIPQTMIVENYLASVGLSFEKDILPLTADEIAVIANLDPVGEGGLPDIRIVGKVKDPPKLASIGNALKNLASNLGIFVQVSNDPIFLAKISYFLFPTYAVYATVVEDVLVVGTSKERIIAFAKHIEEVKQKKKPPLSIPPNSNRFWRVRFVDFNEQLQKLLQSPLLANKGIPPISNISLLKELGDLEVYTEAQEDKIVIRVKLPIRAN